MIYRDPYEVLGLTRSADKETVKRTFRELALKYHPDRDSSAEAAKRFTEIRRAADLILDGAQVRSRAAAAAEATRRSWRPENTHRDPRSFWNAASRRTSLPIAFSLACILGGCALFAGAVHVHRNLLMNLAIPVAHFWHRYDYNTAVEANKRREQPTARQQQIYELLMEKQQLKRMQGVQPGGSSIEESGHVT